MSNIFVQCFHIVDWAIGRHPDFIYVDEGKKLGCMHSLSLPCLSIISISPLCPSLNALAGVWESAVSCQRLSVVDPDDKGIGCI